MTYEEEIATTILYRLHAPYKPTAEEFAAAVAQVRRDREGSRILANDEKIPDDRFDLRWARSRATYLGGAGADAPLTATHVQQLVDAVLDRAAAEHPGAEFGITLTLANALLLPKDSDTLWRNGGAYHGHVYRDCLVTEIPTEEPAPIDHLVVASPVVGTSAEADRAVSFFGDLRTGAVSTDLPEDMRP